MAFRASFPAQRKLGRAILPLRNYDQCAVAESTHAHDVLGVEAILESPQSDPSTEPGPPPNGRTPLSSSSTRQAADQSPARIAPAGSSGRAAAP